MSSASPDPPPLPPDGFAGTVAELHRLAVYVVSPAQRLRNGEIVLAPAPGGFRTYFDIDGGVVEVDGRDLVAGGARSPITTLRAAAHALGIEPDVGQAEQFDVPDPGDLDAPLAIDPAAARALGGWYRYVVDVLELLRSEAGPADDPSPAWIWPEHFDAASDIGRQAAGLRGTYGGSPGDRHHPEPYLYATPWAGRVDTFFDDPGFRGAARTLTQLKAAGPEAGLEFLREARRRIQGAPK